MLHTAPPGEGDLEAITEDEEALIERKQVKYKDICFGFDSPFNMWNTGIGHAKLAN